MTTIEFTNNFGDLTPSLNTFALNLTKNHEDAADLYQETAYRAIMNKDKFTPGTNFKAWLFTIMKNIFINNYRKKSKMNTIMDSTDNMFYINSGNVVIGNSAESNIMMDELNAMVESLDNNIKLPFKMHFDGFKYQEISEELDLPLGTVKSRIFFARKALKHKIKAHYGDSLNITKRLSA